MKGNVDIHLALGNFKELEFYSIPNTYIFKKAEIVLWQTCVRNKTDGDKYK
jgi:hypothetical protein